MHSGLGKVYQNKLQFHQNKLFISFWGGFGGFLVFFLEAHKGNNEKLPQNLSILHAGRNTVCLCAYADIKQTTLWSYIVTSRLKVPARHRKEQNAIKIKGAVQNCAEPLWAHKKEVFKSQFALGAGNGCSLSAYLGWSWSLPGDLLSISSPWDALLDLGHCPRGWQNAHFVVMRICCD